MRIYDHFSRGQEELYATYLADLAVKALVEEAMLSPKPGLVDARSSGAHTDMNITLMVRSACSLHATFKEMSLKSINEQPNQRLRHMLAWIGQEGERRMFEATGGINTHKGAIWALGLLISATSIHGYCTDVDQLTQTAGKIASYPAPTPHEHDTNGNKVRKRFGFSGAIGEAQEGFPHVVHVALPALREARSKVINEQEARLDALLALMATLDDTCILHRGGLEALSMTKTHAKAVLEAGGSTTIEGKHRLQLLEDKLLSARVSPGGSADLLAATLFLDWVCCES
ncbi:triphosphoribosyl-dephospho-CoA synthase [Paenibacillus sp. 2KB_22]|uniref:triphosphoribosyl-dephospho-CoA synthase n=1 Tax=Paenibacillus sp. 2KB_22 TaxID=3232978 RepID=UPI003F9DA3E2